MATMMWKARLWAGVLVLALWGCTATAPAPTAAPRAPAASPVASPTQRPVATVSHPAATATATTAASPTPAYTPVTFAVIGDFGLAGPAEKGVAELVHAANPDFIVTVGDNNYPNGNLDTWDANVTAYYGDYIEREAFFPAWGNHDWGYHRKRLPGLEKVPYLPEPRRFYEFVRGPVHFFVLDSNWQEPAGIKVGSEQARWLQERMALSTTPWQVVVLHHAPYSSGRHGSQTLLQWPYAAWGADIVLAGHDHTYERIERDGLFYIVNGIGGNPSLYEFQEVVAGSIVRFNEDYGALLVWADATTMRFEMHTLQHGVIDAFTLTQGE